MVAPNSLGIYLYAIIPTGDEIIFDVAGAGSVGTEHRVGTDHRDNEEVYTIPHRDPVGIEHRSVDSRQALAALVSASPLPDFRGLKRNQAAVYLVAHQRVVEAVMQDFPLLPVKFGTVLADEAQVRRLLAQGEALFRTTLEKFSGRVQMEVVALWNLPQVFQEIGQEAQIADLRTQIAGRPPEETMAERIAIGQMVQASLEQRRVALRDRLIPPLREVSPDLLVNPPMDDSMVINVALLLDQAGRVALDRQLDWLDQEFGGRLLFRCVGPLPPYSFATVEVQAPCFESVELARRCLGLGETINRGEIKGAYHRLAGQLHPDHRPTVFCTDDDPQAEAHMAELTQAYELLTDYADKVQRGRGAEEHTRALHPVPSTPAVQNTAQQNTVQLDFSREAVEKTLLIAIRRQEFVM